MSEPGAVAGIATAAPAPVRRVPMPRRAAALALTVLGSAVFAVAPGAAQAAGSVEVVPASFEALCTPTEPGLAELSGLASTGDRLYAMGDSGSDRTLWVLDDRCRVTSSLPVPVDPFDVEDIALVGGTVWLSDTGDNSRVRGTVSLTDMNAETGAGALHRLTYPDGAHDAEALLVGRDGRPVIVTKEVLAPSGVYTPADGETLGHLSSPGPTALTRAGQISFVPTDTPGGPVPVAGSLLVTGGAVSADGRIVALRTYTDIYLYAAPDGDVAAALIGSPPVRIPMPNQPQGEAIAFLPNGDLLSASEANGGPLPPIQILRGATSLVRLPPDPDVAPRSSRAVGIAAGVAAGITATIGVAAWLRTRARRRDR